MTDQKVNYLGTPVTAVHHVTLTHGESADGRELLLAKMNQSAGRMFLLVVDPATGESRQYFPPVEIGGGHVLFSRSHDRVFIAGSRGEIQPGNMMTFDPVTGDFDDHGLLWDPGRKMTAVERGRALPCSMDEAPDGTIYVGCYGRCDLFRFDPRTGEITDCGHMDPEEYYFYVQCGVDGTVAGLTRMARPHVVVHDPATGEHRAVGPVADTDRGEGRVALVKGADGLLYIDSHEGWFTVRGMAIEPIDTPPDKAGPPTLRDGSTYRFAGTGPDRTPDYQAIEIQKPDGDTRRVDIAWRGEGTEIYIVRPGPGAKVYGSSILPLHFFEVDPQAGSDGHRMVDYGRCCTATGEIYSLDTLDGKLYYCAYTHAILGVYDPAKPYAWRWPQDGNANPRQIGRMDEVAYRPRDMCAGPGSKVWVASVPDYGMWGGTLSWYDPASDTIGGGHRHIYGDCSPYTLTRLPEQDQLVVGFTIYGGSGTSPRATRTGLVLWDPHTDRETWRGDFGYEIIGVMDLEDAGGGLTYAVIHPAPADVLDARLVLLDIPKQRIVAETSLSAVAGWPLEVTFQRDDRHLYGATREAVYRVPLGTTNIEVLWRADNGAAPPTCGGALLGGRYYFGAGSQVAALDVT